ncbi:MAG: adenylate/guanylate cyclase domain-containing protein [Parvibaculaceae bacterium]
MVGYQDVSEGIAQEELKGLSYMFWGRLAALSVLAVWALTLPFERSAGYLLALAAFALLGAPPYLLARRGYGRTPVLVAFLMLDAAILTYVLVVPPPFYVEDWTAQLNLRLPNFLYLGIFLVGMSLSYSPWLVMWAGIAAIVAWSTGFLWVASLPDTLLTTSRQSLDSDLSSEAVISRFLDPRSVSLTIFINQVVFLGLATLILTATVWRSRQLVRRQVAAESERASLSRYFSPNIVRELSANTRALDRPIVQPAAILFADMVGFTRLTERMEPEALVGLLREFHGRLARVAFDNRGTIDKYIGDAIMVHFGTPRPRDDDPVRALTCAGAMIEEMKQWNIKRASEGKDPAEIGIGLHYGEVVVGNIGHAQRLEFTVLGDVVNVASRLERLTRHAGTRLMISDDLVRAVQSRGLEPTTIIEGLRPDRTRTVRGRQQPIAVWCLQETSFRAELENLKP